MKDFHTIIFSGLIILTAGLVLFAAFLRFYVIFSGFKTIVPFKIVRKPLSEKHRLILIKYFPYFNKLTSSEKLRFEKRLNNFLHNKQFIPMHKMGAVTDEMKVLISASAIQLTLGLPEVYFVHFNKILVFPDKYYSPVTRAFHKGEVNDGPGIIAFSWKAFVEGYINPDDTYNLGLHEMAHALELENFIPNQEYKFLNPAFLRRWKALADAEFAKMREGKSHFLRRYAASTRSEFFPVSVEHFFEKPAEFKEQLPELYSALAALLNQDPLARKHIPENSFPVEI